MEPPLHIGFTTEMFATGLFIRARTLFFPQTVLKIALTLPPYPMTGWCCSLVWSC